MLLGVVESRERPASHLVAMVDEFEHEEVVVVDEFEHEHEEHEEDLREKAAEAVINLNWEHEEVVLVVVVVAAEAGHDACSELPGVKVVHSAEHLS